MSKVTCLWARHGTCNLNVGSFHSGLPIKQSKLKYSEVQNAVAGSPGQMKCDVGK